MSSLSLSEKVKELQGSASQQTCREKLQSETTVSAARAAVFLGMYYLKTPAVIPN